MVKVVDDKFDEERSLVCYCCNYRARSSLGTKHLQPFQLKYNLNTYYQPDSWVKKTSTA